MIIQRHSVMQRQGECARINSYAGMRATVTYDDVAVSQRDRMLSRVTRVGVSGVGIPRPWTQVPTLPYTTLPYAPNHKAAPLYSSYMN
jgi:hypothetical protein